MSARSAKLKRLKCSTLLKWRNCSNLQQKSERAISRDRATGRASPRFGFGSSLR